MLPFQIEAWSRLSLAGRALLLVMAGLPMLTGSGVLRLWPEGIFPYLGLSPARGRKAIAELSALGIVHCEGDLIYIPCLDGGGELPELPECAVARKLAAGRQGLKAPDRGTRGACADAGAKKRAGRNIAAGPVRLARPRIMPASRRRALARFHYIAPLDHEEPSPELLASLEQAGGIWQNGPQPAQFAPKKKNAPSYMEAGEFFTQGECDILGMDCPEPMGELEDWPHAWQRDGFAAWSDTADALMVCAGSFMAGGCGAGLGHDGALAGVGLKDTRDSSSSARALINNNFNINQSFSSSAKRAPGENADFCAPVDSSSSSSSSSSGDDPAPWGESRPDGMAGDRAAELYSNGEFRPTFRNSAGYLQGIGARTVARWAQAWPQTDIDLELAGIMAWLETHPKDRPEPGLVAMEAYVGNCISKKARRVAELGAGTGGRKRQRPRPARNAPEPASSLGPRVLGFIAGQIPPGTGSRAMP